MKEGETPSTLLKNRFPTEMTCDLCGKFTGSAQQVGSHIRVQHGAEITGKIAEVIDKAGRKGVNRKTIAQETGWNNNRIGHTLRRLEKNGLIRENDDHVVFSKSAWDPTKGSDKAAEATADAATSDDEAPKVRKTRAKSSNGRRKDTNGRKGQTVTASEETMAAASDVLAGIRSSNTRMNKRALEAATESLIEAHRSEFVRYFIKETLDLQMSSFSDEKVEELAASLAS